MDVDWTLVNKAKNLAEDQLDQPILKLPIIRDYREPLVAFLRPGMKVLDVGANDRALKSFLDRSLNFEVPYKSMDVDRSHEHDFYHMDEIHEQFDAIACFEVVEHMPPGMALELFRRAHELLTPKGRIFVSTPNVYHPMSFWSDSTHITPFRIRHLAGWLATAGFRQFWGYRVCNLNWKRRWRYWRYRGLLRLLNLDFAPGILVVGEKG
ncbi:MAG: class I SAM-dependent methyltransferase [Deltaproteobacteria bacterium]|nr:class I SAM-dependent methyltransferase [Deltaproteobacteria bacterium]